MADRLTTWLREFCGLPQLISSNLAQTLVQSYGVETEEHLKCIEEDDPEWISKLGSSTPSWVRTKLKNCVNKIGKTPLLHLSVEQVATVVGSVFPMYRGLFLSKMTNGHALAHMNNPEILKQRGIMSDDHAEILAKCIKDWTVTGVPNEILGIFATPPPSQQTLPNSTSMITAVGSASNFNGNSSGYHHDYSMLAGHERVNFDQLLQHHAGGVSVQHAHAYVPAATGTTASGGIQVPETNTSAALLCDALLYNPFQEEEANGIPAPELPGLPPPPAQEEPAAAVGDGGDGGEGRGAEGTHKVSESVGSRLGLLFGYDETSDDLTSGCAPSLATATTAATTTTTSTGAVTSIRNSKQLPVAELARITEAAATAAATAGASAASASKAVNTPETAGWHGRTRRTSNSSSNSSSDSTSSSSTRSSGSAIHVLSPTASKAAAGASHPPSADSAKRDKRDKRDTHRSVRRAQLLSSPQQEQQQEQQEELGQREHTATVATPATVTGSDRHHHHDIIHHSYSTRRSSSLTRNDDALAARPPHREDIQAAVESATTSAMLIEHTADHTADHTVDHAADDDAGSAVGAVAAVGAVGAVGEAAAAIEIASRRSHRKRARIDYAQMNYDGTTATAASTAPAITAATATTAGTQDEDLPSLPGASARNSKRQSSSSSSSNSDRDMHPMLHSSSAGVSTANASRTRQAPGTRNAAYTSDNSYTIGNGRSRSGQSIGPGTSTSAGTGTAGTTGMGGTGIVHVQRVTAYHPNAKYGDYLRGLPIDRCLRQACVDVQRSKSAIVQMFAIRTLGDILKVTAGSQGLDFGKFIVRSPAYECMMEMVTDMNNYKDVKFFVFYLLETINRIICRAGVTAKQRLFAHNRLKFILGLLNPSSALKRHKDELRQALALLADLSLDVDQEGIKLQVLKCNIVKALVESYAGLSRLRRSNASDYRFLQDGYSHCVWSLVSHSDPRAHWGFFDLSMVHMLLDMLIDHHIARKTASSTNSNGGSQVAAAMATFMSSMFTKKNAISSAITLVDQEDPSKLDLFIDTGLVDRMLHLLQDQHRTVTLRLEVAALFLRVVQQATDAQLRRKLLGMMSILNRMCRAYPIPSYSAIAAAAEGGENGEVYVNAAALRLMMELLLRPNSASFQRQFLFLNPSIPRFLIEKIERHRSPYLVSTYSQDAVLKYASYSLCACVANADYSQLNMLFEVRIYPALFKIFGLIGQPDKPEENKINSILALRNLLYLGIPATALGGGGGGGGNSNIHGSPAAAVNVRDLSERTRILQAVQSEAANRSAASASASNNIIDSIRSGISYDEDSSSEMESDSEEEEEEDAADGAADRVNNRRARLAAAGAAFVPKKAWTMLQRIIDEYVEQQQQQQQQGQEEEEEEEDGAGWSQTLRDLVEDVLKQAKLLGLMNS